MSSLFQSLTLPLRVTLRLQEIGYVSVRYGLMEGLAHLGIEVTKRGIRWVTPSGPKPRHFDVVFGQNLSRSLIHLGPTFVKLGQMLAMRPDLVGEGVARELEVLYDRVPPVSFRRIKKILVSELGKGRYKSEFKSIEKKALASASLGQVHRGVLKDGTPVIIKIQKPGVAATVRLDLTILSAFVHSANFIYPKLHLLDVFQDFKQSTENEINYEEEAKNIFRFQKNYRSLLSPSEVVFPKVYEKLSTGRVLVMEPLRGTKLSTLKVGGRAAKRAATKSISAVLEQIFEHGFFHADPHAGNLFFLEDTGQVGFIDLGLVGRLDPEDKQKFLKVLLAVFKKDRASLAKSLYELGQPSPETNYAVFEAEINQLVDEMAGKLKNLRLDQVVNRLLGLARKNGIVIPNRYIMMIRSCLIIDGLAKNSGISLVDVAIPIVARGLLKSYSPLQWFRKR